MLTTATARRSTHAPASVRSLTTSMTTAAAVSGGGSADGSGGMPYSRAGGPIDVAREPARDMNRP